VVQLTGADAERLVFTASDHLGLVIELPLESKPS
jgi:hypothetical protein